MPNFSTAPDLPSEYRDLIDQFFRMGDKIASTFFPLLMICCNRMTSGLNLANHILRASFFVGDLTPLTFKNRIIMVLTSPRIFLLEGLS